MFILFFCFKNKGGENISFFENFSNFVSFVGKCEIYNKIFFSTIHLMVFFWQAPIAFWSVR